MATLTQLLPGLRDLANETKDGAPLAIANVLSKTQEIQDIEWQPANSVTVHKIGRVASLPAGTFRKINDGVPIETSHTIPVTETMGILESYSQVDRALIDLAPNRNAFRASRDARFIEGMGQTMVSKIIYGNAKTDPEEIMGLAARSEYSSLSTTDNIGAPYVLGASGTGSDLTSAWIVKWGPSTVYLIHPPAANIGLTAEDLGQVTVSGTTASTYYEALRTHFTMTFGVAVEDPRCVRRLANIETAGSSNLWDPDLMIKLINSLPGGPGNAVIYVNKTVKDQIDIQAMDKTNGFYTANDIFGVPTSMFRGLPIRRNDAILNTETALT